MDQDKGNPPKEKKKGLEYSYPLEQIYVYSLNPFLIVCNFVKEEEFDLIIHQSTKATSELPLIFERQ